MPVFKLCLKIFKKNLPIMMIYVVVFLAVSALIAGANQTTNEKGFSQTKTNIAFFSEDDSALVAGLKADLGQIANFVDLPDTTESIQDALYYRSVVYIVRVPADFTQKFMNGEAVTLGKTVIPNATESVYVDLKINQYLKVASLYTATNKNITPEELVTFVAKDLENTAKVDLKTAVKETKNQSYATFYFNYLAYSLFAVLVLGISTIILVFNNQQLRQRNACAPMSVGKVNLQFVLANALFSIIAWLIMVMFCIVLDIKNSNMTNTALFLLNSFVFALCAASISFLIGSLAKNRESISAITNVVALGPSFISGVFVPQEMLGDSVLRIASFTPTYWYVKANNIIGSLSTFNMDSMGSMFQYIGVELGFTVAFLALALVVGKRKQLGA